MIARNNNKRFQEKADKIALLKLETDMKEEFDCIEERNKEQHKLLKEDYLNNIKQVNKSMDQISATQEQILRKVLNLNN
jgi:hypothetical protein